MSADALAQLVDELGQRYSALAVLDGPDAVIACDGQAERVAARILGPLRSDDDREAAQAVIDLMAALWPTEPPHTWWATPVGRLVARSIGHDTTDAVTHSIAAAMLGINPKSIGAMVARGHLERHPDGGVTRASVLVRLGR